MVLDGVPAEDAEGEAMLDIVLDAVEGTCADPAKHRKQSRRCARPCAGAVRSAVDEAWGKKPIVKVLVNVVDTGLRAWRRRAGGL